MQIWKSHDIFVYADLKISRYIRFCRFENFTISLCMQIWKSLDIFVFADLKISRYLCVCRFENLTISSSSQEDNMTKIPHYSTFWFLRYSHVRYVKFLFTKIFVYIQKQWKADFLRNLLTSRVNNSTILRIKNANLSGYHRFNINTNT